MTLTRRQFLWLMGASGIGGAAALTALLYPRLRSVPPVEPPLIVSRDDWGAPPPDFDAPNENGLYSIDNPEGYRVYEGDLQDRYHTVVIHHAATYGRDDLHTAKYIMDVHRTARGWADIAYHFLIGRSGLIYEGRPLNVRGTHVGGFNTGSAGICVMGDFRAYPPTQEQLDATQTLVIWLADHLRLTHLAGHTEFNAETQCPGPLMMPFLDGLAEHAGLQRGTEGYIPSEDQIAVTNTPS